MASVFKPQTQLWVQPENATTEEIVATLKNTHHVL
ncbi:MAG: hypothetical protein H7101_10060 [Deinococcales bacterium]|nr:hypothetical protein [Chitinophagaceae bacterium]